MERTSSQKWFLSELPCSWIKATQFSRPDRPKRGKLELWWGKCTRVSWTFLFKLARTSSFRPVRTDKWKATRTWYTNFQQFSKLELHGCSIQNFCFPKLVSLIFTHSILIKMMQFDKEMHFNEPNCQDQHILAL